MKNYVYAGGLTLATLLGLSACSTPQLEAQISVDNIVQMSGSELELKNNHSLIEVTFKLENTSKDMETELKTSAKQFYLEGKDGKQIKASSKDVSDLPDVFSSSNKVEEKTDTFKAIDAEESKTFSLFFEVANNDTYQLYFESNDEDTKGQTVSTNLDSFDGQASSKIEKAANAYIQTILLGQESPDYDKTVANDRNQAKTEFSNYFSDNLEYGYETTSNIMPTGDEVPQVLSWIQTAKRERGNYKIDHILIANKKAEFRINMQTINMKAADDSYSSSHPGISEELQNYFQSYGANTSNADQITKQFYMENYLPNAIKEATPVAPKSEGIDIFSDYSIELTLKGDKWAFPDKESYSGRRWTNYPLFYAYTGQLGTLRY